MERLVRSEQLEPLEQRDPLGDHRRSSRHRRDRYDGDKPPPNGTGSTIAQSVAISGPLAVIFGPLMGKTMATHFVPVLDDLATAAEAAP